MNAAKLAEYRKNKQIQEFHILITNCKVNKDHVLLLENKDGPQLLNIDGRDMRRKEKVQLYWNLLGKKVWG